MFEEVGEAVVGFEETAGKEEVEGEPDCCEYMGYGHCRMVRDKDVVEDYKGDAEAFGKVEVFYSWFCGHSCEVLSLGERMGMMSFCAVTCGKKRLQMGMAAEQQAMVRASVISEAAQGWSRKRW